MVARTRPKPEVKYFTSQTGDITVAIAANRSVVMNNILEGTGNNERLGKSVRMLSIQFQFSLIGVPASAVINTTYPPAYATVILVRFPKTHVLAATLPIISSFYVDPANPELSMKNTISDPNWVQPFKFIWQKRYVVSNNVKATSVGSAADTYLIPANYPTDGRFRNNVNTGVRVKERITFDRSVATTLTDNAVGFYIINSGNSGQAVICEDLKWRVRFTDS